MISGIRKSLMGTAEFDAKFTGMRKSQEFIVYPIKAGQEAGEITIQSDTRIGTINLKTGQVQMSPPQAGGAFNPHLALRKTVDTLNETELVMLRTFIFSTSSKKAGDLGVTSDNSGAICVLA